MCGDGFRVYKKNVDKVVDVRFRLLMILPKKKTKTMIFQAECRSYLP
jgi:hypothetical protein